MAEGRMLKKKISLDSRWADLKNDTHRLLFTVGIAHLDIDGRISGDPREFKAAVAPMLDHITREVVATFFQDAERLGLIWCYQVDGRAVIQYPAFKKNQSLRPDKEAPSQYPPPPPGCGPGMDTPGLGELPENSEIAPDPLPENSGTTPAEVKGSKEKRKKEMSKSSAAKAARPPSLSADGLAELWNELTDTVLPRVRLPLKEDRARRVRVAIKEQPDREWWIDLFNRVNNSSFLKGQSDSNWRADFDFAIKRRDKIGEGSYDPLRVATAPPPCPLCGGAGTIKDSETEGYYECECQQKAGVAN